MKSRFFIYAFLFVIPVTSPFYAQDVDIRVDDSTLGALKERPSICVSHEGIVYVVWLDNRQGYYDWSVYFVKSVDGGNTFGPNVRVGSASMDFGCAPSIAVDTNGVIYVAWYDEGQYIEDYDIFVARSRDGGESFEPRIRIDHGGESSAVCPRIAVGPSGTLYITWMDDQTYRPFRRIYFNRMREPADSLYPEDYCLDCDFAGGSSAHPDISVTEKEEICIVWSYSNNGSSHIYFTKSNAFGEIFQQTHVHVDDGDPDVLGPTLAVDRNNNPHITWFSGHAFSWANVYVDESMDGGTSFLLDRRINAEDSTAFLPSIAVCPDGRIVVVWQKRDRVSGIGNILFSVSKEDGNGFTYERRVDHQSWYSSYPSVAADDSGCVLVVWQQVTVEHGLPDAIYCNRVDTETTSIGWRDETWEQCPGFHLFQNYPNPFNMSTTIIYRFSEGVPGIRFEVSVYSVLGEKIRTLASGRQTNGYFVANWDGKDDSDNNQASGLYFCILRADNQLISRKMLLVR